MSEDIPDPCNLIVNYIPTPIGDAELAQLFAPYGDVVLARVVHDRVTGAHRGFGFVKYASEASALAAVDALNGHRVYTKWLKVAQARGPQGALELAAAQASRSPPAPGKQPSHPTAAPPWPPAPQHHLVPIAPYMYAPAPVASPYLVHGHAYASAPPPAVPPPIAPPGYQLVPLASYHSGYMLAPISTTPPGSTAPPHNLTSPRGSLTTPASTFSTSSLTSVSLSSGSAPPGFRLVPTVPNTIMNVPS